MFILLYFLLFYFIVCIFVPYSFSLSSRSYYMCGRICICTFTHTHKRYREIYVSIYIIISVIEAYVFFVSVFLFL